MTTKVKFKICKVPKIVECEKKGKTSCIGKSETEKKTQRKLEFMKRKLDCD